MKKGSCSITSFYTVSLIGFLIFLFQLKAIAQPQAGDLLWYKHTGYQSGTMEWQGGFDFKVGSGWHQFSKLFATSNGVIYGLKPNGDLVWYKHSGYMTGAVQWSGGWEHKVGEGWGQFTHLFATSNGVIYAVKSDGNLAWYKHTGYNDGSMRWEGGLEHIVGRGGWTQFSKVFAGPNGVIYGVRSNGDLVWYKHTGFNDGSVRWEGGGVVGNGWNQFVHLFATDNGIIYGIKQNGDLAWYKHAGYNDGSARWEGGGNVGNGWQLFKMAFATDNSVIYGVVRENSNTPTSALPAAWQRLPLPNANNPGFAMTRSSSGSKITPGETRYSEENGRYCTITNISEEKGDFEKIVLGNQNDKIYPGAIYFDNAILEGTYNAPLDLQLRPYEIVTDLFSASGSGSSRINVQPGRGAVYDGIAELMRRSGSVKTPSQIFIDVKSLNSTEQLAFELGAGYQGFGVDLNADFNYFKRSSKNIFIAKLKQVYFSVTTNSNVNGRTLIENEIISPNLLYISKVNYGRIGYLIMESDSSREAISAALNFRYNGGGSSVSANARLQYEKTLSSLNIKGFFFGGDAANAIPINSSNQLASFNDYVRNGLRLDPTVAPVPVSYEMKYLNDNATAAVRSTCSYTERQCEPGRGIKIKLHNVAIEEIHGGDCSYAWGNVRVEVWETNPLKLVQPLQGGTTCWERPNPRDPLRTVINYASVRRNDAVDDAALNAIGAERYYLLNPRKVAAKEVVIRIYMNINTNHKDNDFAALGFHGMNRVEMREYRLNEVVKTREDYNQKRNAEYKYGTLKAGNFCSNTDRMHCFYSLFSITND